MNLDAVKAGMKLVLHAPVNLPAVNYFMANLQQLTGLPPNIKECKPDTYFQYLYR